jgi:transketolase
MVETKKIKDLKKIILKTAFTANEGHIASAFSILDVLYVLYNETLNINNVNLNENNRDRFILSKGHSSLGLYSVLAEKGFFEKEELSLFCKYSGILGGHPDYLKVPGVEASTGSLGHGFPIAVGIALGYKIRKYTNQIVVLIGDGESNEGSIWESAAIAAHHNLNNLTCVVDYNHSTDRALNMNDIYSKFESFGWEGEIIDGHNHQEISAALNKKTNHPKIIIANTIKGMGIKLMENNPEWHHKVPSTEQLNNFLIELNSNEKTIC